MTGQWSSMKYILVFLMMIVPVFAAKVTMSKWKEGQTFSQYLESRNIPVDLLIVFLKMIKNSLQKLAQDMHFMS